MPRRPRDPAWQPVPYSDRDVEAVQSLARGDATPDEQRRALRWIVEAAAGAYEISYRSDADGGDRETAFAEGRRFVGLQIVKLTKLSATAKAAMRKKAENG